MIRTKWAVWAINTLIIRISCFNHSRPMIMPTKEEKIRAKKYNSNAIVNFSFFPRSTSVVLWIQHVVDNVFLACTDDVIIFIFTSLYASKLMDVNTIIDKPVKGQTAQQQRASFSSTQEKWIQNGKILFALAFLIWLFIYLLSSDSKSKCPYKTWNIHPKTKSL